MEIKIKVVIHGWVTVQKDNEASAKREALELAEESLSHLTWQERTYSVVEVQNN